MLWAVVAVGGAAGALARYALALWLTPLAPAFPWATLTVNVVGSFLIGVVLVLSDERGTIDPLMRTLLAVGVLGGFTTFSSFSVETLRLWETRALWVAVANVGANVGACLLAVALGVATTRNVTA